MSPLLFASFAPALARRASRRPCSRSHAPSPPRDGVRDTRGRLDLTRLRAARSLRLPGRAVFHARGFPLSVESDERRSARLSRPALASSIGVAASGPRARDGATRPPVPRGRPARGDARPRRARARGVARRVRVRLRGDYALYSGYHSGCAPVALGIEEPGFNVTGGDVDVTKEGILYARFHVRTPDAYLNSTTRASADPDAVAENSNYYTMFVLGGDATSAGAPVGSSAGTKSPSTMAPTPRTASCSSACEAPRRRRTCCWARRIRRRDRGAGSTAKPPRLSLRLSARRTRRTPWRRSASTRTASSCSARRTSTSPRWLLPSGKGRSPSARGRPRGRPRLSTPSRGAGAFLEPARVDARRGARRPGEPAGELACGARNKWGERDAGGTCCGVPPAGSARAPAAGQPRARV